MLKSKVLDCNNLKIIDEVVVVLAKRTYNMGRHWALCYSQSHSLTGHFGVLNCTCTRIICIEARWGWVRLILTLVS